jgi:hypothetical protein
VYELLSKLSRTGVDTKGGGCTIVFTTSCLSLIAYTIFFGFLLVRMNGIGIGFYFPLLDTPVHVLFG